MVTQRQFFPGSEWLYLKIYTGIKTADIILEEAVAFLMEDFQKNNQISKWFFIRYIDPEPHLRIRLKVSNINNYNEIFEKINDALKEYTESGEISSIIVDTYNREIERYGENTMEEAETLFHDNSEFTLQCLHYDDEEKIIISLYYIDQVLDEINLTILEKLEWIRYFNDAFKQEFNADKKLNSQLDKKYREFKPKFVDFLTSEEFFEERETVNNILIGNLAFQNIINHHENESLGMPLRDFFQSIFHMNINRLFISDQRLFEMVIYDYLLRHYKTTMNYSL
ncbi:lantibiotic dehydratase [Chryseobacterium phosphatilyticum]|uniref:Lantibiotic dehydratase n=1 Tax=Chryseobacterium phosphatilyticum TaxID=475075 RepID=A0A316WU76_9FLAO|nr:thiopeptide-type bacteriocin biosynthesis protein [Chryseobacterium phosphatilyticum]PWN65041.1 lantibiotic dehydratase [Chryseobacterium phosphatilyticum]